MKSFAKWFTPERRQLIQVFFGSLAPLVILMGFATQDQTEQVLVILGAVLQFFASLLSLLNLKNAADLWGAIRAAIYTLGFTVSPALVLLGVYDESTNQYILMGVSLGLGALSNLVAIFIGKQQQVENLKERVSELAVKSAVQERRIEVLKAEADL